MNEGPDEGALVNVEQIHSAKSVLFTHPQPTTVSINRTKNSMIMAAGSPAFSISRGTIIIIVTSLGRIPTAETVRVTRSSDKRVAIGRVSVVNDAQHRIAKARLQPFGLLDRILEVARGGATRTARR